MSTKTPYRLCPKCSSRRGVEEFICANDVNGVSCGWDLTNEEIREGDSENRLSEHPFCPNGHRVSLGDLICPECNADLQPDPIGQVVQEIAGWTVLGELSTTGTVRTRYRVSRASDNREAVLTLYSEGAEPDTTVYEALRSRVPRDHIAELIEFGRWDGKAYDVAEEILGGSLASLDVAPDDTVTIRDLVEEIGKALASFMDVGLRHRSLSPDKILIRSRSPLDVVISGFESGRLSELDLDVESPLEVTRYTAPEAIMGGVASASDWWGLGMILLGILTRQECFAGINDQLFLIHVNANGAPIPDGIEPRLESLLQGLLTVDRSQRWQWKEVRAWLDGEDPPVAKRIPGESNTGTGPVLSLGGKTFRDPRAFAIDASRAANWEEACDRLSHGELARWAEELELDGKTVSALRSLGQRIEPAVGFRLSIALRLLNPHLPLIFEEAIVNPTWLLNNPSVGYDLISGPVPDLLSQYGLQSDNWLQRLGKRASAILARAKLLEITLDEGAFRLLALSTSRAKLLAAWEIRRRDFPDASHASLSSILERKQYLDEDLIILLAATVDQFRSTKEIISDVNELASRYGLVAPSGEHLQEYLARTRRDLYALLEERIAGFARCGHERCDAWADQFRLERRLPLANVLLLLSRPADEWAKPPHQEYVSSVLEFFEKKVSGAILRGQLVRMTIAKTTPRIDVTELAPDIDSAAALLENLLQRSDRTFGLDGEIFESPDGPERRMRNLLSRTLQYQRDTGINGAYIGFPFLLRREKGEKSAPRLAPILLWPVKVVGQVGSRGNFSLAFDSEGREVLLNPAFTGMFGLEGAKSWQEIADDVLSRSVAKVSDIIDACGVKAAPSSRTLQPLPRDLSNIAPGEEQCVCSAVLFHMEFMGQSLVEDLRQLKQRPPENTALEPMLRVGETSPWPSTGPEGQAGHVPISDRFLITHSDPSQEEAVVRARSAPGLLIQGPPGTGKSQTIVNLVADCIGHRRSVLIVCQKLPALEVVRKRLVAERLENRLAMVTNITKDRQPLLREIRQQLETLATADASDALRNERRAEDLATQIDTLEAQIDSQHHAAARVDDVSGRNYRQILADLIAIEEMASMPPVDAPALRRLLAEKSDVAVAELQESCGSVAGQWLEAEYENSPLAVTLQFPHDDASITEFREVFSAFAAAEKVRGSLAARRGSSLPRVPAEKLELWLRENRDYLQALSDSHLAAAVPLQALFSDHGIGDEYRELLASLHTLQQQNPREILIAESIGELLASLNAVECEAIAGLCGQHASLWLSACYEESPLHVLKDNIAPPHVAQDVQATLMEFTAAEKRRIATAQKHEHVLQSTDPDRLSLWLEENAEFVTGVAEEHLRSFAQCGAAFETDHSGSEYIETLGRLVTLYATDQPDIAEPAGLRNLVSQLDESQAGRLADATSRYVVDWLEAKYEDSPLRVLLPFGSDRPTCDAFQADFAALLAAEESRVALGPPSQLALSLHDPEPLAAWLEKYGGLLRGVAAGDFSHAARNHRLFQAATLGSEYVACLEAGVALPVVSPSLVPVLAELKKLVATLHDNECDVLAEACALLAPSWLEANYEDSPLRVLLPFGSDRPTCDAFQADFAALLAAEESRVALGPPSQLALSLHDPEPLAAWLEKYGGLLRGVGEARLQEIGSRLSLFESPATVSAYIRLLQQSLKTDHVAGVDQQLLTRLQEVVAPLKDADIAAAIADCEVLAPLWLEANYENSPLRILSTFGSSSHSIEAFRKDFAALLDAEEAQAALGPPSGLALSLHDPESLAEWLDDDSHLAIEDFQSQPQMIGHLLRVAREDNLLDRFEEILRQLVALNDVTQERLPHVVDLEQCLKAIPEDLVTNVERECVAALHTWLDSEVDKVLLDSLVRFPQDASQTARIRESLRLLVEAESARLDVVARCPQTLPVSDQNAVRTWLSKYEQPLSAADRELTAFLTTTHSLFDKGTADKSPAERLCRDLQKLRAEIRGPELPKLNQVVLEKLIAASPEDLKTLTAAVTTLCHRSSWSFLSPDHWRARKCVSLWLRESNVAPAHMPPKDLARHAQAANVVRGLHEQASKLLATVGLEVPASPQWRQLDLHLKAQLVMFQAAHRLWLAVMRCPASFNRQLLLQKATPSGLQRLVEVVRDSADVHDAKQRSLTALNSLTPLMAPSWLGAQRDSISLNKLTADQAASLDQLASSISQLDKLQAFRDCVADCDSLTLKVLGAITPVREFLRGRTSQERVPTLKAIIRHHWLLAKKRHLETTHDSLAWSEKSDSESVTKTLAALAATRRIVERLKRCPVPGFLEDVLLSGLASRMPDAVHEMKAAVVQTRAAKAAAKALEACQVWFSPDWIDGQKRGVRETATLLVQLRAIQSALPSLSAYQKVRERLERSGQIVASALPLVASVLTSRNSEKQDANTTVDALMTSAWCAAQRQLLASRNDLLQSLGECRSRAQQQEVLGTLIGGLDISEAILACPITGELQAALSNGSRERLLESLAAFEAAVNYSRATKATKDALGTCGRWFNSGFLRTCREAVSSGRSNVDALREVNAALPTLSVYQSVREALARHEVDRLHIGLQVLAPCRAALTAIPAVNLSRSIHQLFVGTWLDERRVKLEANNPSLRTLYPVSVSNYATTHQTLLVVRELASRLSTCPDQQVVRPAILSGLPATVSRTVAGLRAGLEIHYAQQAAFAVLDRLEPWFGAEWVAACRTAIFRGDSNELALGPIVAVAHTIRQYQQFRHVVATCDPLLIEVFASLASLRPQFEALPASELAMEVERTVRYAAFTGKRLALERRHPALQALHSRGSHSDFSALETLTTAKRLQQATVACPFGKELIAALSRSKSELLTSLLKEFDDAAEYERAAQNSLSALRELSGFMQPEWIDSITHGIQRSDDTLDILAKFEAALPHLRAYQLFRGRIQTLPEFAVRCFEVLGKYRGALRGAANHQGNDRTIGDLIRYVIRREALLGWKNRLEAQEPALLADGSELAAKVDRLRKLEIHLRVLNRQRLSQHLPIQQIRERNEWTDITRLTGPRAVRLREFFRRGSDLGLLSLRPIWLTTPDVASQLLPLEKALFDLVIFDEASQMPVEYALPCLYRAKTAVVSGDEKQMPPSSFFASRIESDEEEVFDGEMLDEAATDHEREAFEQAWNRREVKDCPDLLNLGEAVLEKATLQVHYRSEYRELIAYSNAAFYQNELGVPVRHPDAAVRAAKPIEYVSVSGTYTSQTNPEEASKVVDLLADLWLTGGDEPPSVGVVTFNLRQAELIEEFLEERAEADIQFRTAYAREQSRITRGEDMSVFVKNVENVQGDERDWIIFSTTFGKTASGRFSRNFGVLGQKGGERRLNVAVTRARRKVVIVSSMPIDDVSDMLKTRRKPETPRDYLQAYLQYARLTADGSLEEARRISGRLVTSGRAIEASASPADGFLDSVASFIRSLGHEPVNTADDPILGVDFSIADPATGLFGVGIECDPPRHRLTQRARAREIWRPSVLERAYRVVHRVSPYAWYHDREREQARLRRVIEDVLTDSANKHAGAMGSAE